MDSSNKVYKWHDKSGNGYDAFGSVNNQLPLYSSTGINSKPALSFDGSNDFLEANTRLGLPANPAITVLMVARVNQFVVRPITYLQLAAPHTALQPRQVRKVGHGGIMADKNVTVIQH